MNSVRSRAYQKWGTESFHGIIRLYAASVPPPRLRQTNFYFQKVQFATDPFSASADQCPLFRRSPTFALDVMEVLARRLRAANKAI